MSAIKSPVALVADIGGTNVRFGLIDESGRLEARRQLLCADFPSLLDAVGAYLTVTELAAPPCLACFAVASPVVGDQVRLTNHGWRFSTEELRRRLGLERLLILHDYTALALALPRLGAGDSTAIKDGQAEAGEPLVVVGPGTGLGAAGLMLVGEKWIPLPSEVGHCDLAAHTDREWEVVQWLRSRFGRVSAERVLSGPGLVNLYQAVSALGGDEPDNLGPHEVVARARSGDASCSEALSMFAAWLGAVSGDLALTFGARGGVYLGGGILPKMGDTMDRGRFIGRFLAKGRFRWYMEPIPVRLVVHSGATLIGAALGLGLDVAPPDSAPPAVEVRSAAVVGESLGEEA